MVIIYAYTVPIFRACRVVCSIIPDTDDDASPEDHRKIQHQARKLVGASNNRPAWLKVETAVF